MNDLQKPTVTEAINPPHYKRGNIECIDAIRSTMTEQQFHEFCRATALAYVWRLGQKDAPAQDAAKAMWYLSWIAGHDPRQQGQR